jgi:agmatinase
MAIALLGIPWDASSSAQRGAAQAPAAIRRALWAPSSNTWNEHGVDIAAPGVLHDQGDLDLRDNAADARAAIREAIAAVRGHGHRPLLLGGDHSITYPILQGFVGGAPSAIVHFDAHGDLYDVFEGDRYSHACPFARIMEERLTQRLIQVGVRTLTAHQREQVAKFGVDVFGPDRWRDVLPIVAALAGAVYVSLDLDVLEPMLAPGISHPEPGGLTVRDVLEVLQAIGGPIIGADVVEYNPVNDVRDLSARVAAKFVKEIAGLM